MVESVQSLYSRIRQKIAEREFHPICIEATMRLVNARKSSRRYEKTEKAKAKHRRWRSSEAGHESDLRRGKRYRDKNSDNPEYRQRRRDTSQRCYRKKRTDALWLLFTFEPQQQINS